jgi:hypothetical protein
LMPGRTCPMVTMLMNSDSLSQPRFVTASW